MITQQTQLKINLPLALRDYLLSKSMKYDMPVAGYVKHLILKDIEDLEYPVFQISDRSEKILEKALKNRKNAIKVDNVAEYFKSFK